MWSATYKNQKHSVNARTHLGVEQLEDRLALSWAGMSPARFLFFPPPALSVQLNGQRAAAGQATIATREVDWYSFLAPVTGSYRINAGNTNDSLDTVLGVYNRAGYRLATNDDANGTQSSEVNVALVAGRRYWFGITNYTNSPAGAYVWQVAGPSSAPVDDSFEQNDNIGQAANLGTLNAARNINNLRMFDGQDWFRFTMTGNGTAANSVAIGFQHAQGDLDLYLYDANGQLVGSSDGASDGESISLEGVAAGTYYVSVIGFNGATNPNYSLSINPSVDNGGGGGGGGAPGAFQITLRISGMTASQQQIFQQAANRWAQIITGDLPDADFNGIPVDDVLIDASGRAIDGVNGILGQAGPDMLRFDSSLPIHGTMQFDTADLAQLEASGGLYFTILHEMGHVLGIGTIWSNLGLISGEGGTNPRFVGAQATAQFNAIFGTNVTSVPVENTGGAGTRDGHWRESVFGNELMTGWLNNGFNSLSRVTAAALGDMGYQVNINAADAYSPAGGSGGSSGGGIGGAGLRAADKERGLQALKASDLASLAKSQKSALADALYGQHAQLRPVEQVAQNLAGAADHRINAAEILPLHRASQKAQDALIDSLVDALA